MTTAERSGGLPPDPDDWDLPAPSGAPCADLPPPVAPTPTELAPEPQPALDHVPFDMDFIARTLARVIGEQTFTTPVTSSEPWSPAPLVDLEPEPLIAPAAPPLLPDPPIPAPPVPTPHPPAPPVSAPTAPLVAPPVADRPPAPPAPPLPPPPSATAAPAPSAPPAPPAPPPPPAYEPAAPAAPAADLLDADGRLFRFAPPKQQTAGETGGLRGIRVALRTLLRQRRRMLLSIVAVALGVGYLAGSLSLLQRVGAGLAAQAGAGTERADLVIEGTIADDGPLQQVRRLVPDTIVDQVRGIEGIAAVEPRLESKSTLILGPTGSPVVRLGLTERPLGANFPTEPSLNPYRFVGEGRAPATDTEVAIDAETAKVAKVKVGEPVLIAGKVGLKSFTVTGIVELTKGTFPAGSSLALFATEVARPLFELGPDDNAIAIKLEPGADRDKVIEQLRAIIFSGAEVSTGAEYAEHRQASFEKSFTLIRALLVGFAALALVVGAFTVANSMALLFDHRRRGFAMLRLMGASPSQLVGAATAEALLGGAIAGVVGLGLGLGVGAAIEWLIQSTGTPLPVAGPVITWWIPVLAVVIGAAVTVSTALSPARHASRTPPVHAVTGADDRPSDRSPLVTGLRWLATVVVVAVAAALLGSAFGGTGVIPLAAGAGAAVAIVLVILPRLLSGIVGVATSLLLGKSVALRRMSTLRSRQARTRAASTTAALLLAAAVVTSLTVLSSSFLRSVEGQVSSAITADFVVDSATFATGGLSADLVPLLRQQPGVAAVSGWRVGNASIGLTKWRAAGIDGASMFELLDLGVEGTPLASAGINDVVVSTQVAERENLQVGQTVPVRFENNAVIPMRVRAIFDSNVRVLLGDVIVDSTVMAANLPQSVDVMAFVKLTKDAPVAATRQAIEVTAKKYGAANVLEPSELVSKRADLLRGFGRVIQWMLAFSIALALIGVANTLQLGVNERRRELGLIRAVGATRQQVLRLVMAEAGALSVVGTLFGMVIGAAAAYATVSGLSAYGLDQFVAPVGTLVFIAVISIGLGLLGAILPAWRAAGVPLLDAISDSSDQDHSRSRRGTAAGSTPARASATRPVAGPRPTAAHHAGTPPPYPGPPLAPDTVVATPVPADPWIDHGSTPGAAAIVGPPSGNGAGAALPPPNHEVLMALRCYNCGNEPGDGESCIACGAPQTVTPVGMFTLRPGATNGTATNGSEPVSSLGADIVDAAVVENGVVIEPAPTSTSSGADSASAPPPYVATSPADPEAESAHRERPADSYAVTPGEDTPVRSSLGSIFDGRPTPSEAHDPMRSPFGQHASAEPEPPVIEEPLPPAAPAARHGIFSAGTADPSASESADSHAVPIARPAPAGPPPAFASAIPAGAQAPTAPASSAFGGPTQADTHGLAASVARLSLGSQQNGLVPFSIAGALLGPQEHVVAAVAGTSLGMPTVIVVTETRALIVSDRRYVPEVEIFELGAGLTIHGRHANEQASLTFTDGERLITVDQIVDVGLAVELANTARNRTVGGDF